MKIIKLILTILVFCIITNCKDDEIHKKIIYSKDKANALTVLTDGNNHYLVNGDYKYDVIPANDFLLNDSFIEYHIGLAKWTSNGLEIYQTYGQFDKSRPREKMKSFIISTKEFEELKKDSLNYKYFYY